MKLLAGFDPILRSLIIPLSLIVSNHLCAEPPLPDWVEGPPTLDATGSEGWEVPVNGLTLEAGTNPIVPESAQWVVASLPGQEKTASAPASPPVLKVSGTYRLQYESHQNYDFTYSREAVDGMADNDDNYLLSRLRVGLDLRPNPFIEGHVTFQDSRVFGSHQLDIDLLDRRGTDIYENEHDLHEAWVKLKLGESPLAVQAGRMQLNYGDERLLGGFNWSNTARTFDAFKLIYHEDRLTLDLVAANVVVVDSNAWDRSNGDDDLLFAYAQLRDLPQGTQDVYLMSRDNETVHKQIYTAGTRIDGKSGSFDWNLEGAYQWGTSADTLVPTVGSSEELDHRAFATHLELGRTSQHCWGNPRLAAGYDFATGDKDPNDGENNTFDNLFPTNHPFYGYMDFFSWRNLHNPYLKLSWAQTEKLKIRTFWHLFWLDQESNDGWYNAGGGVLRNAGGADVSSFVGHEFDLVASYEILKDFALEIGYGHFFAENYIADTTAGTGGADDADFFYLQTIWTF